MSTDSTLPDRAVLPAERPDTPGSIREDISNEIVSLYKRFAGKGPVKCHTYLQSELVTVVLGGGYTASEQTLFEDGKWHEVRRARQIWQDTMQARFVEVVETRTGRTVVAFMSANHQDPDLAVELFVLSDEPEPAPPQ